MTKKQMIQQETTTDAAGLGQLALRLAVGALLVGHRAQKLFGWFGGPGLEGTSGWLASSGALPAAPRRGFGVELSQRNRLGTDPASGCL